MHRTSKAGKTDAGYTYAAVLIVLVGLSLTAQTAFIPAPPVAKRQIEAQIIFEGLAYRDAIGRYWAFEEQEEFPPSLDALLQDPRDNRAQHIRRLYSEDEWSPEYNADGDLIGVVPTRSGTPLKQSGFQTGLEEFEGAANYGEWVFLFVPNDNTEFEE